MTIVVANSLFGARACSFTYTILSVTIDLGTSCLGFLFTSIGVDASSFGVSLSGIDFSTLGIGVSLTGISFGTSSFCISLTGIGFGASSFSFSLDSTGLGTSSFGVSLTSTGLGTSSFGVSLTSGLSTFCFSSDSLILVYFSHGHSTGFSTISTGFSTLSGLLIGLLFISSNKITLSMSSLESWLDDGSLAVDYFNVHA